MSTIRVPRYANVTCAFPASRCQVRLDCLDCTAPAYSVLNGIKVADTLAEKYDVEVVG